MDEDRKRAYRVLLAAALLHLKWDLACFFGGPAWFRPYRLLRQMQRSRRAACRAFVFHNLAIFSSRDFHGFSETLFWQDIERFQREFPDDRYPYRAIFDRCLRGDPFDIIAPDAGCGVDWRSR
jgi:hypothetical protein